MPGKEEKAGFISALLGLAGAIKTESDVCGKLCGGLSEKELFILVFVGENRKVKMSEIAEGLAAPLSTLTSIVDKLVEKKYLSRDHSEEDRRVVKVSLAQNGKEAYKLLVDRKQHIAGKVLSRFSEKERGTLIEYVNRLSASINSEINRGSKPPATDTIK
jgi:DNA-binding MarR family transcriptional regulator